ncbi:hypothetical protein LSAT2_015667 [Lamellibrachia satsuma]|nr:hypothetical protein LSAT2_015667 [Lamellibrachia satsuma]
MSVAVCVILVANALVNSAAATDSWTKSEFPNPQLNVDYSGNNGSKSWVCDPTRLLTRQEDAQHVTVPTWRRPVPFPSTWETRCGRLQTATTKTASNTDVSPLPRTESGVRKKLADECVRMVVNETSDIFKDRRCGKGLTYIPKQYLEVQSGKRDCFARSDGTTSGVVFGIFGVVAGVIFVFVYTYFCCGSCCDNSGDVNSSNRPETANRTRGNYLGSAHHSNGTGEVVFFVGSGGYGSGGCGSGLGGDGGVGFEDGGCGGGFDSGAGGGFDSGADGCGSGFDSGGGCSGGFDSGGGCGSGFDSGGGCGGGFDSGGGCGGGFDSGGGCGGGFDSGGF